MTLVSSCNQLTKTLDIVNPLIGKYSCQQLKTLHGINLMVFHGALSVVQYQLESDPSLGEDTSIRIDNLMEMLMLCVQTTFFQPKTDTSICGMLGHRFTNATSNDKHIHLYFTSQPSLDHFNFNYQHPYSVMKEIACYLLHCLKIISSNPDTGVSIKQVLQNNYYPADITSASASRSMKGQGGRPKN